MSEKVNEIIDRAIYGNPEIKREERNLFLSTIKERIHLALTKKQVIVAKIYPEVSSLLKLKSNIQLFINGDLNYKNYSNYIQEANKLGVQFTIIKPTTPTPFGLVIAEQSRAVDVANFYIEDELYYLDMQEHNEHIKSEKQC